MNNFIGNISADAVLEQLREQNETKKQTVAFDKKNYLNTRLENGQTSKTLTIRLLPFNDKSATPFFKVYTHIVKVNKELAPGGWKQFICPAKNHIEGQTSDKCPFCETAKKAREIKFETEDPIQREKMNKVEFQNSARESWIVRCIERGHEEDGVKFWLFSHSRKGDGIYDKIMNIFQRRYSKGRENGEIKNIFDLQEGKDLEITVTLDTNGKSIINIVDDDRYSPLSTDVEQANQWINDPKQWYDVYSMKSYDYMSIVINGDVPYYNKDLKKYVKKEEAIAQRNENEEKRMSQYVQPSEDFGQLPNTNGVGVFDTPKNEMVEPWNEPHNKANYASSNQSAYVTTAPKQPMYEIDDDKDDLPF